MEDSEVEECEVFSCLQDDGFNPDVDLSYIDEKIQNVLGHFQKDFEGGVCVENLGAKFGGYGSFLPVQQRSPSILSQPRSSPKLLNHIVSRSSYNRIEDAQEKVDSQTVPSASVTKHSISTTNSLDKTDGKGVNEGTGSAWDSSRQQDLNRRSVNINDKKPLKVRVKVAPENVSKINTAAIYSGLGLEVSPSTSLEESLGDSGGFALVSHDSQTESPMTVFQFYTCLWSPNVGSCLLSPIPRKLSPSHVMEDRKPHVNDGRVSDSIIDHGPSAKLLEELLPTKSVKHTSRKAPKLAKKNAGSNKLKKPSRKRGGNDVTRILNMETNVQTPDKNLSGSLLLSHSKSDEDAEPKFDKKVVQTPGNSRASVKMDKKVSSDILPEKQLKAAENMGCNKFVNDGGGRMSHARTKLSLQSKTEDKTLEDQKTYELKKDDGTKEQVVEPAECVQPKAHTQAQPFVQNEEEILQAKDTPSSKLYKEYPYPAVLVAKMEKKRILNSKGKSSSSKSQQHSRGLRNEGYYSNDVPLVDTEKTDDGADKIEVLPGNIPKNLKSEFDKDDSFIAGKVADTLGRNRIANSSAPAPSEKVSKAFPLAPPDPVLIEENWVCCDKCQKWRLLPYGTNPDQLPKKWLCCMLSWLPGMNRCSIEEEETTRALHRLYQQPAPEGPGNLNDRPGLANPGNLAGSIHGRILGNVNQHPVELNIPNKLEFNFSGNTNDFKAEKLKNKHEKHKQSKRSLDEGDILEKKNKNSNLRKKRELDQDIITTSKKIKLQGPNCVDDAYYSNQEFDEYSQYHPSSKKAGKHRLKYKGHSIPKESRHDSRERSSAILKKVKAPVYTAATERVKEQSSTLDLEKSITTKKRRLNECAAQPLTTIGADFNEEASETETSKDKVKVSRSNERELSSGKKNGGRGKSSNPTKILLACNQLENGAWDYEGHSDKVHQLGRECDRSDSLKRSIHYAEPATAATSSSSKVSGSRKSKADFREARGSPVESVSSSPMRTSNSGLLSSRTTIMKEDGKNITYSITGSPKHCFNGEYDGSCDIFEAKQKEKNVPAIQNGSSESNRVAESSVLQVKEGDDICVSKAKDLLFSKIFGHNDDDPSPSEYEINGAGDAAMFSEQQNKYRNDVRVKDISVNNNNNAPNSQKRSAENSTMWSKNNEVKAKASKHPHDQDDSCPTNKDRFTKHDNAMDCRGLPTSEDSKNNKMRKKGPKISSVRTGESRSGESKDKTRQQVNMEIHASSLLVDGQSSLPVGKSETVSASGCKTNLQENLHVTLSRKDEKPSNLLYLAHAKEKEGKGYKKSKPGKSPYSGNKHGLQNEGLGLVATPTKESRSCVPSKEGNGDTDKVLKQPAKSGHHSGSHRSNLKNLTPNRRDGPGPARKDGAYANLLKEARDLKHTANRLQSEGLEQDSTGLYFQAALKFLHVALLMEPSGSEITEHGYMASIEMYSGTGSLCKFCAHEFEKCKQMAAAALAYKCMEVAYMKVVYHKHSYANKDRRELQNTSHGESPSSSASDIDNINQNSKMVDKAVSVKGVSSSQVAGNLLIPSSKRPNLQRFRCFVEDVNFAMEASKRSSCAFTAAYAGWEEVEAGEAMLSVRRVLDFNFHDVEGLLRLVRHSMEYVIQ